MLCLQTRIGVKLGAAEPATTSGTDTRGRAVPPDIKKVCELFRLDFACKKSLEHVQIIQSERLIGSVCYEVPFMWLQSAIALCAVKSAQWYRLSDNEGISSIILRRDCVCLVVVCIFH